jgi:uncharacterized protein (DUF305 family)
MQKKYVNLLLLALMLVAILALASCANSGSRQEQGSSEPENDMQGMAHGSESTDDASEMLMENGEYSDERFIDAMVPHHQGAIEMAQVALENAEHPEILALAEEIVAAQETEIEQLKAIKQEQFGTSEVSMDTSAEEMEGMGMAMDPQELATQEPFDKAFIDKMIPHHLRHSYGAGGFGREREPRDTEDRRGHRGRPGEGDRTDEKLARGMVPGGLEAFQPSDIERSRERCSTKKPH